MKTIYKNRIMLISEEQRKKEVSLIKEMLDVGEKERKLWISGQN